MIIPQEERACALYIIAFPGCGGLTLTGCQVPTTAALSLPFLSWTGKKKNTMKGSCVEIRTRRSLTNYHHGQNRLDTGKLV